MFYSIRRFLDKRFERRYYFEVAKFFAANATFTSISTNTKLQYLIELDPIIEDIYDSCYSKLKELIPKSRHIKRRKVRNSEQLLVIRCFATRENNNNIVYGTKIWLKTGRRWLAFNPNIKDWETVKFIPSNNFSVTYEDSDFSLVCDNIEIVRDFFFVY